MAKAADVYFQVDPWKVIEQGFDPAYARVSESIFSLGNESIGVRGCFASTGCAPTTVRRISGAILTKRPRAPPLITIHSRSKIEDSAYTGTRLRNPKGLVPPTK